MPAKRVILLGRTHPTAAFYRYVLWADVPSGNQIAYRNPSATSEYENATPAELQAIRDGLVAERVGQYQKDSATLATIQTALEAEQTSFQTEVTNQASWADYGRYWDGTAWQVSPGVPMVAAKENGNGCSPSFIALTPVSAFGANKFHLVLHNSMPATVGQSLVVKVCLVVVLPGLAAVTGAAPSAFTLRRRSAPSTAPSGSGSFSVAPTDSAYPLPTAIVAYNAPGTAPSGGTTAVFNEFVPQADEQKLTTADAPTLAALFSGWGGQVVYKCSDIPHARPLAIRAGETLEVQQSATAGTGNCRILCLFTVG